MNINEEQQLIKLQKFHLIVEQNTNGLDDHE